MTWLSIVRLVTFVMVLLFSIVVLALSVDLIVFFAPFRLYLKFTALGVATGGVTLLTVLPMFLLDVAQQCRGNIIVLDILWLSILWAFWLASGSYHVWSYTQIFESDPLVSSCNFFDPLVTKVCQEFKVIIFLSFPASIFLMVYTGILLFLAIFAQNRGHNVWGKSVREPAIFYPKGIYSGTPARVPTIPAGFPLTYPPQAYPPKAYPPQAYPPQAYPRQAYPPQTFPPQTSSPALTHTSEAIQV